MAPGAVHGARLDLLHLLTLMHIESPPLPLNVWVMRIAAPALVLCLYFVVLFVIPRAGRKDDPERGARPLLTQEQSRELSDLCDTLMLQGKFEQALQPGLKLYQAYPENHVYARHLATMYNQLGRYKLEAQFWERFREHAPRPVEACPNLAQAYENAEMWKDAVVSYEWCLTLEPNNTDSIFFLGRSLERDGQLDRAVDVYQKGLVVAPNHTDLRIGLARALVHKGVLPQARETIIRVLAESPTNTDAMLVYGLLWMREGNLVKAREYLERGAKQSETYTDFHILLGQLSERENKIAEALQHYERALQLSPGNMAALRRRNVLRESQ